MSQTLSNPHHLPDINQTAGQLSAIQLTGVTSLPVLATSILILESNNFISAILTLLVGNILLWIIRLGIVGMSYRGRKSTLDISRDYVGNFGAYIIAVLLLAATLAWFIAQTTFACNALSYLIPIDEGPKINTFIQMSVALGIISTLLCMEGIVVLRWLSVLALPIIILAFLGVLFAAPLSIHSFENQTISLSGLPLVLGTNLGVTADLPTFFRHSRSWKSSFNALLIIQVVSFVLGIGGLFLGSVIEPWFGIREAGALAFEKTFLRGSLITLIFLSTICANVANVYSASVGWEIVAPVLAKRKEYLILGLGLTTIYILVSDIFSMDFLLQTTDSALVNLCLMLIFGYIISRLKNRHPSPQSKIIYLVAWLLATILNILQFANVLIPAVSPLFAATGVIFIVTGIGFILKGTRPIQ